MRHAEQSKAMMAAARFIGRIPSNTRWALNVTDEDDKSSPSTLNIYVASIDWREVANKLDLKFSSEQDKSLGYMSWRLTSSLLVSLIDEEAK